MKEVRSLIERIVQQEIKGALANSGEIIKEVIETSFLPELKIIIRNALQTELANMLEGYITTDENPSSPVAAPEKSSKTDDDKTTSSSETETSFQPDACNCNAHSHSGAGTSQTTSPGTETPPTDNENATPPSDNEDETLSSGSEEGRYLYCLVENNEKIDFGNIGIEGNRVYTIPWKDISAVAHNCPTEPYKSEDEEVMKKWVLTHQQVTDTVWEKFGTVLPLGFDTIIQGKNGASPDENTGNWLKEDYDKLKEKFEKIRGKAEYGVQVFWDPQVIARKISKESPAISDMEEEIKSKPKGLAYMYQQKLENLLKAEMEKEADRCFKDFFERIKNCVDDIKVEKTKKLEENKHMLLNFACLLLKEKTETLGNELEKIDNMEGFSVRFTGPWPPYGFV